jgi:hypothetical protein
MARVGRVAAHPAEGSRNWAHVDSVFGEEPMTRVKSGQSFEAPVEF